MNDNTIVSSFPARRAVQRVVEMGGKYFEIAEAAGVHPSTISGISSEHPHKTIATWRCKAIIAACGEWQANRAQIRKHLLALSRAGYRVTEIADVVGVNRGVIERLRSDSISPRAVHPVLSRKILAISDRVDQRIATTLGAQRRLQGLVAWGYGFDILAEELGISEDEVMTIIDGEHNQNDIDLGRRITETFARLEQTRGPDDWAREYGETEGWPIPFQWDEYTIDRIKSHIAKKCDGWETPPQLAADLDEDELALRRARVAGEIAVIAYASA